LKETFVKVVNVTQGILKTVVIPGVKKILNPNDGQEETIEITRIDLGEAKIVTTVLDSMDVYDNLVTFEF